MKFLHSVISATILLAPAGAFAAAGQTVTAQPSVTVQPAASIEIPGATGKFDFLRVDEKRNRLLAAHENGGTADYFDLGSHKLLARVKVGGAVDNAVDADSKYYYVSVQEDKRVAVVDAATLKEVKSIPVTGRRMPSFMSRRIT